MMKKKGILVKNFLTLIIAAVGLGIIGFAAVKFFGIALNDENERAQAVLDSIKGKVDNLQDGESGEFTVRGVKEWTLTGWSKEGERPEKCFFNSCICVCKGQNARACDTKGFCRDVDRERLMIEEKLNKITVDVSTGKGANIRETGEFFFRDWIDLSDSLIRLEVEKTQEEIAIRKNE
jgi:hypothetical protein